MSNRISFLISASLLFAYICFGLWRYMPDVDEFAGITALIFTLAAIAYVEGRMHR
jgi:hypothetical protein